MERENLQAGHNCLTADTIGRLVKDIWGEKVRIVRRGARGNTERRYLHLARREDFSEKMEISKNWSCVVELVNETCLVRMESYLFNKQRAATEVIVQEVDGVNAFYIRANGTEQCLSSVLNLALERNFDGESKQIAMVLKLIDTYELCKGYEPAAGEKMLTSLQHNLFSACQNTCEVTRAFSTDCQIVHKRKGGGSDVVAVKI